ncbi:hypothetical protein ETAA8_32380 [Anatilimnocola aggregata]|uniref:Leucine Rich repeats (2 copies) n=1 Tax=Anatilimnocola aggregata TaxID=2528021 RepID=A0A517YD34_9BACT|nr:hypothetical protein ETAA8_32380 [Anatilimnocola aggregata]
MPKTRTFISRFRFSLRAFVVVLTLFSLTIGYIAERWRRVSASVRNMKRARAGILYRNEAGIGLLHGADFDTAVAESRRWHFLRNFTDFPTVLRIDSDCTARQLTEILEEGATIGTIQEVSVWCDSFSDSHAKILCRYPHLRNVSAHSETLTSEGARCLLTHRRLRSLDLMGCVRVTDSIISSDSEAVLSPSIAQLELQNTLVSQPVQDRLQAMVTANNSR